MITETIVLKAFETRCRQADPAEFELYAQILAEAMSIFRLTGRDIAELLEVSPATVSRWLAGKNAPHAALRRVHYREFAERASRLLRREAMRIARQQPNHVPLSVPA